MLSKRTIEILENNDMHAHERSEQRGEFVREIEFYSPEGEDVIETIFYDGTDEHEKTILTLCHNIQLNMVN